jgi:AcrR family transcriptional regulator
MTPTAAAIAGELFPNAQAGRLLLVFVQIMLAHAVRVRKVQPMANPKSPVPLRSNSRSNRARILAVARQQLSENPDVAMDDIARSAGVVRRTLYGHFPGRAALLEALVDEATGTLLEVLKSNVLPGDTPEEALARFILAGWEIGDRYSMLLSLARADPAGLNAGVALTKPREVITATLLRGQEEGVFARHLPAEVQAVVLEALAISLLDTAVHNGWDGTSVDAAVAALIAAGVVPDRAVDVVRRVHSQSVDPAASPA